MGTCNNAQGECSDCDFSQGPMTIWLLRLWETCMGYDLQTFPDSVHFVSEKTLADDAKSAEGRLQRLRGRDKLAETGLHYNNAMQLGRRATKLRNCSGQEVITVLFRDCDGTRSAPGQLWNHKWQSMLDGFEAADFHHGVPMLPKPKSEAWMLSTTMHSHHSHKHLESISGNDSSPSSAKAQLDQALGSHLSAAELAKFCNDHPSNWDQLNTMPSFKAFHDRFHSVAEAILRPASTQSVGSVSP